jgi:hypothetical protein
MEINHILDTPPLWNMRGQTIAYWYAVTQAVVTKEPRFKDLHIANIHHVFRLLVGVSTHLSRLMKIAVTGDDKTKERVIDHLDKHMLRAAFIEHVLKLSESPHQAKYSVAEYEIIEVMMWDYFFVVD